MSRLGRAAKKPPFSKRNWPASAFRRTKFPRVQEELARLSGDTTLKREELGMLAWEISDLLL